MIFNIYIYVLSYYRRDVLGFAAISAPLAKLIKGGEQKLL